MTDREFNQIFKPGDAVLVNGKPDVLRSGAVVMRNFIGAMVSNSSGYVNIELITKPAGEPTAAELRAKMDMALQHLATIEKYVQAAREMLK